jgi:TolB protein
MDSDGGNTRQLTSCGKNSQPSASPDGKWVIYVSACEGLQTLWRVSIEGGHSERLTDKVASWPWVSPDSKWIACGYEPNPGRLQLAIIPIAGGPPAKLFDVPPRANFNYALRWTPDGRAVTYRDWGKGLWRQVLDGGPAQQIPGLPQEKFYCYGWSRDGKTFAFSRGTEMRDAVYVTSSR